MAGTIIKRGYLWDKKKGMLLDRKRWFVLRQDVTSGCPVLESFRDEKAASRGDSPKAFVNVHNVVEVRRVVDRKQTFELLCPGLGYKFTAGSELETEEWMEALSKLTLYRKENARTLSLDRATQPLTIAPRAPAQTVSLSPGHMHVEPHPSSLSLSHSPTCTPYPSLPTPPESVSSPPVSAFSLPQPRSADLFPSPSTSSDSSSLCSGSTTSFEQVDGDSESRSRFRVHVKENEALGITGPADLVVTEDGIALHSVQTGQLVVSWPIGALRRYGVNNVCFTIHTGRYCSTGEGKFQFYTNHSRLVQARVHAVAMHKASGTARRASEPSPSHPPNRCYGISPPSQEYTHIDRGLTAPVTVEQYGTLSHPHLSTLPSYDQLHHPHTLHPSHSHSHMLHMYPQCPTCQQINPHTLHTLPTLLPSHHHMHPHPSLGMMPRVHSFEGACVDLPRGGGGGGGGGEGEDM